MILASSKFAIGGEGTMDPGHSTNLTTITYTSSIFDNMLGGNNKFDPNSDIPDLTGMSSNDPLEQGRFERHDVNEP